MCHRRRRETRFKFVARVNQISTNLAEDLENTKTWKKNLLEEEKFLRRSRCVSAIRRAFDYGVPYRKHWRDEVWLRRSLIAWATVDYSRRAQSMQSIAKL